MTSGVIFVWLRVHARPIVPSLLAIGTYGIYCSIASAQAFLPGKGEGSIGTNFQHVNYQGHFRPDGSRNPRFQSQAATMIFDIEYGLTDRLAASANLAYVNAQWTAKETPYNLPRNVLDDGKWHGSPQDFRFDLRYNAVRRPFSLTPFVAAIIPSHSYDFIGEAAPGRHLRELLVGAYAGRLLNPVLPRSYVHGSYSYAFVEGDLGLRLNRSNTDLQFGHFVTSTASVSVLWRRQWTHGGVTFAEIFDSPEIFANHDRLTRANYQHVGAGVNVGVTDSLDVFGTYIQFVSGTNEHYGRAIALGVRWNFKVRREPALPAPMLRSAFPR